MSLISLAKDSAEHHFHELNGKSRVPTTGQFFPTHIFYILQIALRLPTLALLTIYLGDWFGLFLVTMLPANFLLASLTLNTLTAKNVWTGLLSTMSPICFVSKEKIRDHLSKTTITWKDKARPFQINVNCRLWQRVLCLLLMEQLGIFRIDTCHPYLGQWAFVRYQQHYSWIFLQQCQEVNFRGRLKSPDITRSVANNIVSRRKLLSRLL